MEAARLRLSEDQSWSRRGRSTREWLLPFCLSALGIALITGLSFLIGLNVVTGGFLYLIVVVVAAVNGGLWSGTLTSIVAAACMDYFFFPPLYHFNIDDPMDWVALGTFEVTALVITLLQQQAQQKAAEAEAARKSTEKLYNAARGILFLESIEGLGNRIASLIREEFDLRGVVLFDAATDQFFMNGNCDPKTQQGVRDAYLQNSDAPDPDTQTWFCALRVGTRAMGGLALCGVWMPAVAAQAIASLCAISFEKARLFEKEAKAEAARQAEQLRAAVLDALAHQIKTPLCVIQVASSGLLGMGELSPEQAELAAAIDEQGTKLNGLVSRLLGASDLETAQIEPHLAPVLLSDLVKAAVTRVEDAGQRARFQVSAAGGEAPALADGELMVTVLEQLVDNAIKYSVPRSPITVTVTTDPDGIRVSMQNQGGVITPSDRDRIFERFYRREESRQGPEGTGLGLSIAKRIVEAHHGRIWVESESAEGTTFVIVLPKAPVHLPGIAPSPDSVPAD